MGEAPLILGVSGLRGIVGESLTPEVAVRYAAAFGGWLRDRRGPGVVVVLAQDGRRGGAAIQSAAAAGLMSAGCAVKDIGWAPTPTVGVAVDEFGAAAGLQVTASHNPQEWNGLKCLVRSMAVDSDEIDACAPSVSEAAEIVARFEASSTALKQAGDIGGMRHEEGAIEMHARLVRNAMIDRELDFDAEQRAFAICADSVNTSSADLVQELAQAYGCSLTQLAGLGTGIFPHTPEPTAENLSGAGGLCDAVPGMKADVGFAQDPDGDRLAIVDERGVYIGEEYTLAIAAEALLGAMAEHGRDARATEDPSPRPLPGGEMEESEPRASARAGGQPVLVTNLSTSRMIEDVAAAYGARVERTAVGEANVVERMKALKAAGENCVLGGEGNGGVIWPEVTYVRDSLGAMALTLGLMASEGKSVSEIVSKINGYARGGGYSIVKRKQDLASKVEAEPAVRRIAAWARGESSTGVTPVPQGARVDTQDGVRVDFDSGDRAGSWVHVRASNTEPILRLIAEAADEAAAGALLDEVAAIVNEV